MGDSDITLYISFLAFFFIVAAIIAFVIAWRVHKRAVRVAVGLLLLTVAGVCGLLSLLLAMLVAALGVASLALAAKAPQSTSKH